MELVQACVFLGIGTIAGLLLCYFLIKPKKEEKISPQGNFGEIHTKIKEAQDNLLSAAETLENLCSLFEEVSEINGSKNKQNQKQIKKEDESDDDTPKFR